MSKILFENSEPICKALVAALKDVGFTKADYWLGADGFPTIQIRGKGLGEDGWRYRIGFDQRLASRGFRPHFVGIRITVGSRGNNMKSFPQKKDGSFSYVKIAEDVKVRFEEDKREIERNSRVAEMITWNTPIVDRLTEMYGVADNLHPNRSKNLYGIYLAGSDTKPGHVRMKIMSDLDLTDAQAVLVLETLKQVGYIKGD